MRGESIRTRGRHTSAAGASQVALTVKGTGLSPRAQWNVQRSATPPIPPVELTPADMINGKPTIVQPPPSAGPEPEFATELNLTLTPTNPKAANIVAEAKLTIRNPDGRIAEVLIK